MIGIYKITNKTNKKSYIGQSKHIKRKWREHVNGLENSTISNAIKKYGEGNFSFEVLELCTIEELNDKEIYYIKKFKTFGKGYNMTGNGIKARCEMIGLPILIKEIKSLYGRKEPLIEGNYNEENLSVETMSDLVEFIVKNNLTTANSEHIKASIRRVLNGKRKSYLGINIKIRKEM